MRTRWRQESDRSDALRLDLKQGLGALVDIEFLMQAIVLEHAPRQPALLAATHTLDLIQAAARLGLLTPVQAETLTSAHALMLSRSLASKLDAKPRLVHRDAALDAACTQVLAVARELDLAFD